MTEEEVAALVALSQVEGIGPATLLRHLRNGPLAAWRTLPAHQRTFDPDEELERHLAAGRHVLAYGEPGYPARLLEDPSPPALLFAQGRLDALDGPAVAVVGTRNATRLGRDLAGSLGAELTAAGVAVVSGLALGIDGAAHRGAVGWLGHHPGGLVGRPIGVIASGLDVVYPRRHLDLHRQVASVGLLVSETPLGHRPVPWRFPARNRIIAGLVDAVVVVESRSAGGSMLTAGEALDRGVSVLAVPGHPTSGSAAGTNDLIFDGATIVRSAADVLGAIGVDPPPTAAGPAPRVRPLTAAERLVVEAVGAEPAALSEIVGRSALTLEVVSAALVGLESDGFLVRSAGWYEAVSVR